MDDVPNFILGGDFQVNHVSFLGSPAKNPTPGDLVGCFFLKVEGEVSSCLWRAHL